MAIFPTDVVQRGAVATRPAAGIAGRLFLVTDSGSQRLTYDDGAAWQDLYVDPTWAPGSGGATGARVYNSGNQSSSGTFAWQSVTFDTVSYDTGSYANLGTHSTRLTVTDSGLYAVQANIVLAQTSGAQAICRVLKGGATEILTGAVGVTAALAAGILAGTLELTGGDYIELQVYQTDSTHGINNEPASAPAMSIARLA